MAVHDTIGDFITVIRNAGSAGKSTCQYPHSNLRAGIATILRDRGFVEEVSESEKIRGYKKTKDGKTTSFFHRDIDDEAKKLIGNIAPKKITTPVASGSDSGKSVGSVWNQGGTYEEKNMDK